jgi:hypothetical protein
VKPTEWAADGVKAKAPKRWAHCPTRCTHTLTCIHTYAYAYAYAYSYAYAYAYAYDIYGPNKNGKRKPKRAKKKKREEKKERRSEKKKRVFLLFFAGCVLLFCFSFKKVFFVFVF